MTDRRILIGFGVLVVVGLLIWLIVMCMKKPAPTPRQNTMVAVPSTNYYGDKVTTTPGTFYANANPGMRIVPLTNATDPQSNVITTGSFYQPSNTNTYITPSLYPGKTIDYNSLMLMNENQWLPDVLNYMRMQGIN